jgi:hypothetical protein
MPSVLLSPIATATVAFARATRTQMIAVCQVGHYCGGAYANCMSIAGISRRKVTDSYLIAAFGRASITGMMGIVALILVV